MNKQDMMLFVKFMVEMDKKLIDEDEKYMSLRIKDKNRYYNFIRGEEFNVISQLVNNNKFYNKLGRKNCIRKR